MASTQPNQLSSRSLASRSDVSARLAEAMRRVQLGQSLDNGSLSVSSLPDGHCSAAGRALVPIRAPPSRMLTTSTGGSTSHPSMALAVIPPPRSSTASTASTASTTHVIHPAEQLRLALIENRNMNRIDQRVQREGKASPTAAEAERRLARLRSQIHHTALIRAPSAAGLFKNTCASDLLFLIDTTYSMNPYLEAAKDQVTSIVRDLSAAFFDKAPLRVGVVSYKDHGDNPHIQCLDFTDNINQVVAFLGSLSAKGGDDEPEDVLGALRRALAASWKNHTRCIVHITDAPPHGRTLHDLKDHRDNYAEPGSEPHRLTHPNLLQMMISQNINYTLLRINHSTDRMAYVFYQAYAAISPDCSLLGSNKYAEARGLGLPSFEPGFQGWAGGSQGARRNIKFAELKLGTSYHSLRNLVVQFVTTSATNSATFNPPARHGGLALGGSPLARELSSTSFSTTTALPVPPSLSSVALETKPPQWDAQGWLNEEIKCAAYSTEVLAHDDSMLDRMMESRKNIVIHTTNLTVSKRDKPFAKGAMRLASYARSGASRNRLVVKTYMRDGITLLHLTEDMCAQALCKAFALEFNAMLPEEYSLDFIVVTCLEKASEAGRTGAKCMSLEPLIKGEYVKYNSNAGWVNNDNPADPISQAAQAFSHFTFERSRGRFMVTDLQGVGRVLTDPALQTLDPNYLPLTGGNLSAEGFCFFFLTHKCNSVCKQLGLLSTPEMLRTGRPRFRATWPTRDAANMLVCCSNKLCSRIVRMSSARTSDDFPGYRWCRTCWPELEATAAKVVCTAPGHPPHEFKLSRFFYESQGQILPRRCPKHSDDDASAPTTATSTTSPDASTTCRFGKSCTNMACPFLHPTPACGRGKKCEAAGCTYRHPIEDCRFQARCLNPRCMYRHAGGHPTRSPSASAPSPSTAPTAPDCRYGAECTNKDCLFQHPVSFCRRGAACAREGCPRRHPKQAIVCRDGANCIAPQCVYEHPSV